MKPIAAITNWIANAPSTQLRIMVTLCLTIGTAIRYWAATGAEGSWQPNWEWLLFLAGMAGLDVWQHYNKRRTAWDPKMQAEAEVIRNGHTIAGPEEIG